MNEQSNQDSTAPTVSADGQHTHQEENPKPPKPPIRERIAQALPQPVRQAIAVFTLVSIVILSGYAIVAHSLPNATHLDTTERDTTTYSSQYNSDRTPSQPQFWVLVGAGIIMIILTYILLAFAQKSLGFSKAWLLLALAYNSCIVAMKFVLSPAALYAKQIRVQTGDLLPNFDPFNLFSIALAAIGVCLIYIVILVVIKKIFASSILKRIGHDTPKKRKFTKKNITIVLIVAVLAIFSGAWAMLLIPLLFFGATAQYLSLVLPAMLIFIALGLGSIVFGFDDVRKQILASGDITLLASFFWLALLLILSFHIIWIAFLALLAFLWPFNVVYYSSK